MEPIKFIPLNSYQTNKSVYKPIVFYEIINQKLKVWFKCEGQNWNTTAKLPAHKITNWGLWEFDVFEVFLQIRGENNDPYFEFQVSPLGQEFSLKILEPRKDFLENKEIFFQTQSEVFPDNWQASFEIDLTDKLNPGDKLFGNFHAVLGPKENRNYYSLMISGKINHPDFHIPNQMVAL